MPNSYFQCQSADRFVTVWPSMTGERAFYDVTIGDTVGEPNAEHYRRVTAFEAAAIIITEIGCGVGMTNDGLARRIGDWRRELDAVGPDGY